MKPLGAILAHELERRKSRNPRYSLRALALTLGLEPSFLSKIIRGERAATPANVLKIGKKLGIKPAQLSACLAHSEARAIKAESLRFQKPFDVEYSALADDQFELISDWHHFAILELLDLDGFSPTPASVAKALGMKLVDASQALERLARLGLLQKGTSYATHTSLKATTTNTAQRKLQAQILGLAADALERTPIAQRSQSSVTFAMDSAQLEEARELLGEFRRRFARIMKSSAKKDRVYSLSLSLFPVSRR